MKRLVPTTLRRIGALAVLAIAIPGAALAQGSTGPVDKHNMRSVGYDDLQGRSAYQPIIENQGGRFIAYVGHHAGSALNPLTGQVEPNGTSIVDVTNPENPKYLHHIPGQSGEGEAGGAQMVRMCPGSVLPQGDSGKFYLLRTNGTTSHEIYDVSDPANPTLLTTVVDGLNDTHKSWWDCQTGIGYLVSGVPGWGVDRMLQVFDLSDPANPVFIRNFGLPGSQPGGTPPEGNPLPDLHGPIVVGNRVYMGYGTSSNGILQILDRDKLLTGPADPTDGNLLFPQIARYELGPIQGAHTVLPLFGIQVPEFQDFVNGVTRDVVFLTNEAGGNQCMGAAVQMSYIVDITTETEPHGVANYHVDPDSALEELGGNYCDIGGRFGAHSSNENLNSPFGQKVIFVAYFNAGVRAVDVRNPWSPRELGYYVPRVNPRTMENCVTVNGTQTCKIAIQTNNVEVDARGFIYPVDRAGSGMHILEVTQEGMNLLNKKPKAGTPQLGEDD